MQEEIPKTNKGETQEVDDHQVYKLVHDSSTDHKGNLPLRASTGAWKASLFIITIDFSERLAYFGIAMNLIIYFTKVIHQDLKTAAKNVNYWMGVTTLMTLFGAFLADAYFGRFSMIMLSSIIYILGLSLLTMAEFIPSLKPCHIENCSHAGKVHEVVFFVALYFLSLGTGGHKPSLASFGADQFDDNHSKESKQKMSFFNLWNFALSAGHLLGATVLVYVQDHVGWGIANLILTLAMAVSFVVFYLGKPFYRYRVPNGSPITPILQVLVAAIVKRNLPHPSNPDLLYAIPESQKIQGRLLCHTNSLRFLDKAAILETDDDNQGQERKQNPWRLATVTMVEETKLIINMVPIWFTTLIFGLCIVQSTTFFVKQSSTMDRKIGSTFEIPPASVGFLGQVAMLLAITLYEKVLIPLLRRATGNECGIKILQRIGIGLIFPILAMAVAALIEKKRLRLAEREVLQGKTGQSLPMSVFWLAPQYVILGIADTFALVGLQEYFYEQVPDSMRSLGMAFFFSGLGVGILVSSILITIVVHITEKFGSSWLGKDLNSSRLDKYYWLVAAIGGLNLCVYVFFAKRYSYKRVKNNVTVADSKVCHGRDSMA